MSGSIRELGPDCADACVEIWRESVTGLASKVYAGHQIAAWAARIRTPEVFRTEMAQRRVLGWCDRGRILGFAEVEPNGHVDRLYVRPESAGRGIASSLLAQIIKDCREQGLSRLYTEASEQARPVFARMGFMTLERQDFEIEGVPIHNYAMEIHL